MLEDTSLVERTHLLAEAMKIGWQERLSRFGDPDFVEIDISAELADSFVAKFAPELKAGLESPKPGKIVYYEPLNCTSHISTADSRGNMVSLTQTHGGGFGSMFTVPGTGLLFGHGVGRFDPRPGFANSIAPGKRPLHNMAPMLALRGDAPFATYGIPGGRTIPNNQLSYFGEPHRSAHDRPRSPRRTSCAQRREPNRLALKSAPVRTCSKHCEDEGIRSNHREVLVDLGTPLCLRTIRLSSPEALTHVARVGSRPYNNT